MLKFFSPAFHKDFLVNVLFKSLRLRRQHSDEYQSPFAHHASVEFTLAVVGCAVLLIIGIPRLINQHSAAGGIMAGVGLCGFIAMIVSSVRSERGNKYSFEHFVPSVFFFFILLGLTTGLSLGYLYRSTLLLVAGVVAGLLTGYAIGMFAGIGINYLGWIGRYLVYLVIFAIIVMMIFDAILAYMIFS